MTDDKTIMVHGSAEFKSGDVLIVSSCQRADIIIVDAVSENAFGETIHVNTPLSHRYEKNAEVGRYRANCYYVGNPGRKNSRRRAQSIRYILKMIIIVAVNWSKVLIVLP